MKTTMYPYLKPSLFNTFHSSRKAMILTCLSLLMLLPVSIAQQKTAVVNPAFLDDVSSWHSEVYLDQDYTKFNGKYIDGLVIGNGSMLAIEGMTTGITRFNKSRLMDSRLHGSTTFGTNSNGFVDHQSRSPKLPLHYMQWVAGPLYTEHPTTHGYYFTFNYSLPGKDMSIQMNGWKHERQYRVRNTNIVRNILESDDVSIQAVDFMLHDTPALVRNITLTNTGTKEITNSEFYVNWLVDPRMWSGSVDQTPLKQDIQSNRQSGMNELDFYMRNVHRSPVIEGDTIRRSVLIDLSLGKMQGQEAKEVKKLMLIYSPEGFASAYKGFMLFRTGDLKPGESKTFSVYVITAFDGQGLRSNLERVNGKPAMKHLEDTYTFWKNKISEADKLAIPLKDDITQYEKDYIDNVRLFLLSCHVKGGGCIAHPYSYNYVFFRDGYDVYRAMLALGHREECKNTVFFFRESMHRMGIGMSYSPVYHYLAQTSENSKIEEVRSFGHFKVSEFMLFFPAIVRDYINRFPDDELLRSSYDDMKVASPSILSNTFLQSG